LQVNLDWRFLTDWNPASALTCRSFPKVFQRAEGAWLYDREGKAYIDFLCGAGSLNYGHNPPALKRALVNYIEADGVAHALDLATGAKERFLLELEST
jgi:diaminobutyrate-2-oxoglutarate transaminase